VTVERDQRLVEAARRGDAAAFEELYHAHRDLVLRLAYRWTGSHDDAEDVLQEAFAYLLGKLAGLTLSGRLSTLLYPVVKHLARDARVRRGRFVSEEEALAGATARVTEGPQDGLAAALALLPEHQRAVLTLRAVEGYSLEEIASALEIPLGTVKSRLHLALAALRDDPRTRRYFEA
jgi:RNA polymerase sigma-70 factor (ECF subfamily)